MSQIRIKNFGPIFEGFTENEGWMEIHKITVFIGNQGTGKSSVAKLLSTFTWLEKALHRGDIKESEIIRKNKFEGNYCNYHRLKNYFKPDTEIEYKGEKYNFTYKDGRLSINENKSESIYLMPKIMYVPAERNFLSAVEQPEKLKGLPKPLYTFLEEYHRSLQELSESIPLPVGDLKLQYQRLNKTANVVGNNYKIRLLEASSGLQSSVPVFLVSRNLALSIGKEIDTSRKEMSIEEEKRMRDEIDKIFTNSSFPEEAKRIFFEKLFSKYKNSCFINIVEELEQNLFPKSQKDLFFKLLEFANHSNGNKLILTTHSPYIINYLTLVIKAKSILEKQTSSNPKEVAASINKIVPISACIDSNRAVIYTMTEPGEIIKLPVYHGLPSDENFLNTSLAETNQLFDNLLEIEESL